MKIRYHRTQAIPEHVTKDIQRIIATATIRFPDLRVSEVDVVLVAGWSRFGVTGNTFYKDTIMLIVDMNRPWRTIRRHTASTFCHELHHIGRFHTVGYGKRLAEAVVSEGLAVNFEMEMGYSPPPYSRKLSGAARKMVLRTFKKERRMQSYGFDRWFFGGGDLPDWAIYRLGAELVGDYCKREDRKPSELVSTPAATILRNHPLLG